METNELIYRTRDDAAARSVPSPYLAGAETSPPKGNRRAFLWGIGGTLLSVVGFVAMLLFEQYNGMIAELRNDLKHFNETYNEFVKKESFQRYREQFKECYKEVQASSAARTVLEQELRVSEHAREEMLHEFQRLRERVATVEGRQSATPIIVTAPAPEK